ncbi:MAG: hypothetical protein KTR33_03065, partial [Gammaproteobacteria bacterium]|nr:hypothetical protein [Gammaproteobacteria bacterium]
MQLTVGKKIFGIALSVLLLMLVSAGTSITLTAKISQELHLIARRIVPLSESVSKTNVMMLEQGIVLQRLIGLIELPGNHLEAEREDEQIILVLEDRIEQEIQTGQQLLEELESAGADVESLQGRYEDIGRAVTQFKHY